MIFSSCVSFTFRSMHLSPSCPVPSLPFLPLLPPWRPNCSFSFIPNWFFIPSFPIPIPSSSFLCFPSSLALHFIPLSFFFPSFPFPHFSSLSFPGSLTHSPNNNNNERETLCFLITNKVRRTAAAASSHSLNGCVIFSPQVVPQFLSWIEVKVNGVPFRLHSSFLTHFPFHPFVTPSFLHASLDIFSASFTLIHQLSLLISSSKGKRSTFPFFTTYFS